jgi:hypothetical protein
MQVGGQRRAPAALPPENKPVPILEEPGWVLGPVWTGMDLIKSLDPTTVRTPDQPPARSESLYHLRYPGPVNPSTSVKM